MVFIILYEQISKWIKINKEVIKKRRIIIIKIIIIIIIGRGWFYYRWRKLIRIIGGIDIWVEGWIKGYLIRWGWLKYR